MRYYYNSIIIIIITSINTGAIARAYVYVFLNMHDIILVNNNIVMLLS